jgi:RNA polymerase sigma-70 factor (ECF subfamily)
VPDTDWLAGRFEEHRNRLRSMAYRMLGSMSEADDAVQETWLRLSHTDADRVDNLGGWLTTALARVCLDMLRRRDRRHEEPMSPHVPEPIVSPADRSDPEHEALLANAVGLALLVVLERLAPAERLAFVLHDMFAVPFDEIAPIVGRSPTATRQLASRARRRVQGTAVPDADLRHQRRLVDAFFVAARNGNFEALLAVLDPEVVVRADFGLQRTGASREVRGAESVARSALTFRQLAPNARSAMVNGTPGLVARRPNGTPYAVLGFTVRGRRIVEIDILADPERLERLDLRVLDD